MALEMHEDPAPTGVIFLVADDDLKENDMFSVDSIRSSNRVPKGL